LFHGGDDDEEEEEEDMNRADDIQFPVSFPSYLPDTTNTTTTYFLPPTTTTTTTTALGSFSEDFFFASPPPVGPDEVITIAVFGDMGTAEPDGALDSGHHEEVGG